MKKPADILLVENGFYETRDKAKRAIMAGIVIINEIKVEKSGTLINVDKDPIIRIKGNSCKYVSRGGLKLEKAIQVFDLDLNNKKVLDVGSSTGGFTDCSLQNGASFVYAVDVGTNQLDWKLRSDSRVKSLENTHIRDLTLLDLNNEKVDYIVMDVSFISITKVIEHLLKFFKEDTKLMALIKPQFELDRENIGKGGIVEGESNHIMAIKSVIDEAKRNGLKLKALDFSPIAGTKGNIEYISLFEIGESEIGIDIESVVKAGKNLGGAI